jgi:putative addiction module component (TIGR02574 family)
MKSLGLDRLSRDERISLVEELWESIAAESQAVELTDAQRADLRQRLNAYQNNPKAGDAWHVVRARLESPKS